MPITLTPLTNPLVIGPGVSALVQTNISGPFPTGTEFQITYYPPAPDEIPWAIQHVPTTGSVQQIVIGEGFPNMPTAAAGWSIRDGDQAHVSMVLQEPTGVIDQGTTDIPWSNTIGLPQFIGQQSQTPIQGGFTDSDRANQTQILNNTNAMDQNWQQYETVTLPSLQDVLNGITQGITATLTGAAGAVSKTLGDLFSGRTFDAITTFDFGTACAPDVLQANLGGGTFFGIQMECTSHADWYTFTGDADDYTIQAMGTLQIFRGGNLILRHGLHTLTHMVYPLPAVPLTEIDLSEPVVPGDYVIVLTPAPETCWHLVGLGFP